MKANERLIGKTYKTAELGSVKVTSAVNNSRVLVNVICTDRGEGWDEKTQSYKGVKKLNGWHRGENRAYGQEDTININTLNNDI